MKQIKIPIDELKYLLNWANTGLEEFGELEEATIYWKWNEIMLKLEDEKG